MAQPVSKNPIQSAERIFGVLEFLSAHGSARLIQISDALGLSKSTVHRLLASLISMEYVQQESATDKYYLTFKLVRLAEMMIDHIDIVALMRPFLTELAHLSRETVHLVERQEGSILYIDKVESTQNTVRMASRVGLRDSIFTTAVGKCMLAQMNATMVQQLWQTYQPTLLTPHTILTFPHMSAELEQTKQRGFALDIEQNEIGVCCIAGCVLDRFGRAEHAFSISAPTYRMTDQRLAELSPLVLEYSKKMSAANGYIR